MHHHHTRVGRLSLASLAFNYLLAQMGQAAALRRASLVSAFPLTVFSLLCL